MHLRVFFLVNESHSPYSPTVECFWKLLLLCCETLDSVILLQRVGIPNRSLLGWTQMVNSVALWTSGARVSAQPAFHLPYPRTSGSLRVPGRAFTWNVGPSLALSFSGCQPRPALQHPCLPGAPSHAPSARRMAGSPVSVPAARHGPVTTAALWTQLRTRETQPTHSASTSCILSHSCLLQPTPQSLQLIVCILSSIYSWFLREDRFISSSALEMES